VVKHHRKKNKFLQNVPDDQLTHFVQNVRLSADFVTMSYVIQGANPSTGTWNMSAMYLPPPLERNRRRRGADRRKRAGTNPIPLSAKRSLYGHPPAVTAEDLIEEAILLDPSDSRHGDHRHASRSLQRGWHERGIVHNQYIQPNGATKGLAVLLQALGPATPQETSGEPNANGWATLTPILDDTASVSQPERKETRG
jgi:hypothetical protein